MRFAFTVLSMPVLLCAYLSCLCMYGGRGMYLFMYVHIRYVWGYLKGDVVSQNSTTLLYFTCTCIVVR